jgi:hypothetical protein
MLVLTPAIAVFGPRASQVLVASKLLGRHADGSVQLINQRTITPAGAQSDLGDLPLNAILSPDGRHLLVSNSGAGIQSLQVVDTCNGKVVQDIPYTILASIFIGLTYSPDGRRVYASGGGSNLIHTVYGWSRRTAHSQRGLEAHDTTYTAWRRTVAARLEREPGWQDAVSAGRPFIRTSRHTRSVASPRCRPTTLAEVDGLAPLMTTRY